jgi:hypothetical protein
MEVYMPAGTFGRRVGLVAGLVVLALGAATAQPPKGLEGTWKLDVAKSTFHPGPAPTSMTLTYTPVPNGVKIVVDMTGPDGTKQRWEMTPLYDGKDHPVTGHPNADTISVDKSEGAKSQSTFKKGGKVTAVNMRTLSADGRTLTIESTGTDEKGQAIHNKQVFVR